MYTGGNGAEWRQRGGTTGMPMETTAKHRANWIGLGWVTMTALPVTILGLPLPLVVVVTRLIETDRPTDRLPQPPTSSPVHVSESDQPIWELIPSSGAHLSVGVSLLCHPFISHPVGHYRVSGWLAGIRTFAMGVQWIAVVLVAINREPSPPPAWPPTRHMCRG